MLDLRVFLGVLAKIKASIVDYISLLHDIGPHGHVTPGRVLTDGLKADVVVWMGCSSEALEHTLLSKEQGTHIDGEDGALFDGVLLLKLDVLGEEVQGLRLVLEHVKHALTTGDDDDIEIFEFIVGVLSH
jgi:hypothetical protein